MFYHGIVNKTVDPAVQETHIGVDQFEKQMQYLRENYEVISIEYLYECISHGYKIHSSQVVLTFDDGYKNNLYYVAPFLRMFNMPFTVFISTKYVNEKDDVRLPYYYVRVAMSYTEQEDIDIPSIRQKYDMRTRQRRASARDAVLEIIKTVPQNVVDQIVTDLMETLPADRWLELNALFASDELMDWEEVRKLYESGITIGSHCHDHAILHSGQSNTEVDYQLKSSKDLIEKNVGTCHYFSYPNGRMIDISHYSLKSVERNEYYLGLTTVPGEVKNMINPFIVPRIYPHKDIENFKFALNTSFRHNDSYKRWCASL